MATSTDVVENMAIAFVIIVLINTLVYFRLLGIFVEMGGSSSMFDMYISYQQSLENALNASARSIPIVSTLVQLIKFSLRVYLRRIPEITIISAAPTLLFSIRGFLWLYLVPQWAEEYLDDIGQKMRNYILLIRHGESFVSPPPLEVNPKAVTPLRSKDEDNERFHPKHTFRSALSNNQMCNTDKTQDVSVWDPTWGVISREIQETWQKEELTRMQEKGAALDRSKQRRDQRRVPPVRGNPQS